MIIKNIDTEKRNKKTTNIDQMTTREITECINNEDNTVAEAVRRELDKISEVIDIGYEVITNGGKIFYIGAGTSGRLGVLDAAECPPTFGVSSTLIQGVIAGGEKAFLHAIEGAEDDEHLAQEDLILREITEKDFVIGIAASGRTPYVIGGLKFARKLGCKTAAISMSKKAPISGEAQIGIEIDCGPEVITGSTRLKSGTAQKMVLNMISTGVMIKCGKVYENLMVDVQPTNEKLRDRMKNIVMEATGCTEVEATNLLEQSKSVKIAIVMKKHNVDILRAEKMLVEAKGKISNIK